jgi:hypothetical protein
VRRLAVKSAERDGETKVPKGSRCSKGAFPRSETLPSLRSGLNERLQRQKQSTCSQAFISGSWRLESWPGPE